MDTCKCTQAIHIRTQQGLRSRTKKEERGDEGVEERLHLSLLGQLGLFVLGRGPLQTHVVHCGGDTHQSGDTQ